MTENGDAKGIKWDGHMHNMQTDISVRPCRHCPPCLTCDASLVSCLTYLTITTQPDLCLRLPVVAY